MRAKPLKPLSIYDFGRQLIEANDLDPVYTLVWHSGLSGMTLRKWLLAYWAFYHVGTASWIVDQPDYWTAMETAAGSKDYPRSSERRHYRGRAALESVAWLKSAGLRELFGYVKPNTTASHVMRSVRTWREFGPWIAFKVADMSDRVGLCDIQFNVEEAMYDSPAKAAEDLYRTEKKQEPSSRLAAGQWAFKRLEKELGTIMAPPRQDRTLGPQEFETVLCKHKSYLGGSYHVGEDVVSCKKGLEVFKTPTAGTLLRAGVKGELW